MPEEIIRRVLGLIGYTAYQWEFEETSSELMIWVRQAVARPFYTCSGCGIGSEQTHSVRERRVHDLPWGAWKVWLVVEVHRVYCRRCGVRAERIEFLEGKHHYTRRFAAAVARDCEDAAVRRVAAKWGLAAQTVRRIGERSLLAWAKRRRRRPLRQMGVDMWQPFPDRQKDPGAWLPGHVIRGILAQRTTGCASISHVLVVGP